MTVELFSSLCSILNEIKVKFISTIYITNMNGGYGLDLYLIEE